MPEGVRASILGGGGAAGAPLMWGLERVDVEIPPWIAFAGGVVSTTLIFLSLVTCAHMTAVWLLSRGRRGMGQALIVAVGLICMMIGTAAVAYAFFGFGSL